MRQYYNYILLLTILHSRTAFSFHTGSSSSSSTSTNTNTNNGWTRHNGIPTPHYPRSNRYVLVRHASLSQQMKSSSLSAASSTSSTSSAKCNNSPSSSSSSSSIVVDNERWVAFVNSEEVRHLRENLVQKYVQLGRSLEYAETEVDEFLRDRQRSEKYIEMRSSVKKATESFTWEDGVQLSLAFLFGLLFDYFYHVEVVVTNSVQ